MAELSSVRMLMVAWLMLVATGCSGRTGTDDQADPMVHAQMSANVELARQDLNLPASAADAAARLASSPRHGEWAMVRSGQDSIRAWIVFPERSTRAPVVLVVHEIFGLSHWVRGVADQLAAAGFIAIAPDLLTMKDIPAGADGAPDAQRAQQAIRELQPTDVHRWLRAVAAHGMSLPSATNRYGIVGYCWGGQAAFMHAVSSPALGASVVYYGTSPEAAQLPSIRAPVLGLYAGDDARVNQTVPPAAEAMERLGKVFEVHTMPGAGHGFLRQQEGRDGANLRATRLAWPLTVDFLRKHLDN
jgi:carboxymethylenebutenolidase